MTFLRILFVAYEGIRRIWTACNQFYFVVLCWVNSSRYNSDRENLVRLKEYEKVLADYNKAIELGHTDAAAYNGRGSLYARLKEYEKALADYNRAIELDDTYALAYNNRGNLYEELNEYGKARADHNRAIELDVEEFFA